jgi:hypothetical protein
VSTPFASAAWLLRGLTGSAAGWLAFDGKRLGLSSGDTIVFEVPLEAIERLVFPWYYFGGGMKIRVGGTPYRLSFVRPNGAEVAMGRAAPAAGVFVAIAKVQDMASGRAAGRRWRQILRGN